MQISIDDSEFRPYRDQLLASELRSKFHQELAENVFASAVTSVTPVGVVLGVFDDGRLAGSRSKLRRVLCWLSEFGSDGKSHDVIFDQVPI